MIYLNKVKEENEIIFIIPGFLSNYKNDFASYLYFFTKKTKKKVVPIHFTGYEKQNTPLPTIENMIKEFMDNFHKTVKKYKNIKKIIFIAHSQGSLILLKAILELNIQTEFQIILLNPAIYIKEVVFNKIGYDKIKELKFKKKYYIHINNKKFIINDEWIKSYEKINIIKQLSKIQNTVYIISSLNDYIDKKNLNILNKKIKNKKIFKIDGDHIFNITKNKSKWLEYYLLYIINKNK